MATGGEEEAGPMNGMIFRTPSKKNDKASTENNCKLDVLTRLRMSETENAVLQQQISLLLAEKSAIEESSTTYYSNWQFALIQCGRITEEKNEIAGKLAATTHPPTVHTNSKKSRREVEQLKLALDTQNRVCEQLEQERDRANDDFQSCRAQLTTLLDNYHILATASAAVARERDAAQQEVLVLRQHLAQWNETVQTSGTDVCSVEATHKELVHCKERLKRVEQSRNQAVKDKQASDSIITLWQHKHENVLRENRELKEEVLAAQERISFLQEQLAVMRLQQRSGVQPAANGTVEQDQVSTNTSPPANTTTTNSSDEVSWI